MVSSEHILNASGKITPISRDWSLITGKGGGDAQCWSETFGSFLIHP